MNRKPFPALIALAVCCVAAFASLSPTRADEDADPPGRVARLSYVQGEVSLQPAGTDEWTAAVVNRPLTTGDRIWVDKNSRAELQVGSAVIHLDQGTGFSLLELDDDVMQMRVTEGAINVRVRSLDDNETIEIDTPNVAASLQRAGEYRVDVDEGGDQTAVAVRSGESEVTGDGQTFTVRSEERGIFTGTTRLSNNIEPAGPRDDFDAWSNDRDARGQRSASARYVAPDVIGYEDLDESGTWDSVPEYGNVWYPRTVVVGWSPYRYGHWSWIAPWGWTWIDDAAWGFAPFHYGRWAYVNTRWCWVPGPVHVRPVYAPALVAWVRGAHGGPSVRVGGQFNVGWFPLGPRDVYLPGHHVSERYVRQVNVANTTYISHAQVTNMYGRPRDRDQRDQWSNRSAPGAITAVPQQSFVNAEPVGRHFVRGSSRELMGGQATTSLPSIAPDRGSVIGAGRPVTNIPRPPARAIDREVVVRHTPPASTASFAVQQHAIQANGNRPLSRGDFQRLHDAERSDGANRPGGFRSAVPGGLLRPATPAVQNNANPPQRGPGIAPSVPSEPSRGERPEAIAPPASSPPYPIDRPSRTEAYRQIPGNRPMLREERPAQVERPRQESIPAERPAERIAPAPPPAMAQPVEPRESIVPPRPIENQPAMQNARPYMNSPNHERMIQERPRQIEQPRAVERYVPPPAAPARAAPPPPPPPSAPPVRVAPQPPPPPSAHAPPAAPGGGHGRGDRDDGRR